MSKILSQEKKKSSRKKLPLGSNGLQFNRKIPRIGVKTIKDEVNQMQTEVTKPEVTPSKARPKAVKEAPRSFSDLRFSIVQLTDLFPISRVSLYEYHKTGLIKQVATRKSGAADSALFGWDTIEILAKRLGEKITKPTENKIKIFANLKGGVGKSTLAAQFAMRAAARGLRVLALDLDPQAHLTKILKFEDAELNALPNFRDYVFGGKTLEEITIPITPLLSLIPGNLSLSVLEMELFTKANREQKIAKPIRDLKSRYDLVVIDTNPSPSTVNISAILGADEICIVTETDTLSTEGLSSIFQVLKAIDEDFDYCPSQRVIANKFDVRLAMAQKSIGYLRDNYGDILLPTVIGQCQAIKEAQALHQPIWAYDRHSVGSKDIAAMTDELLRETAAAHG